jgi:maleylacetoacetate isomerase
VKLYSYFRSSAAYRVRIALNLKGIPYEMVPVHLTKEGGRQRSAEFRAINPQMRVPAIELSSGEVLTQSLAIIEYLDDIQPEPPLLPADALARARVRAIAQMVACDIHPLNNLIALQYIKRTL